MASLNTFFRVNTDTVTTLIQSSGNIDGVTPFFTKTVRVLESSATPATATNTNILDGSALDTLIAAIASAQVPPVTTGVAYIFIQVAGRGSLNAPTDGAKVMVSNLSTFAAAEFNIVSHTLINVGDNVLMPWRVDSADQDIDQCPNIDATLTVPSATDVYIDLEISVFYA